MCETLAGDRWNKCSRAFSATKLENVGIKTLVKKLGKLTARIQESSNNIEIILPNLSTLAKLFVEAM